MVVKGECAEIESGPKILPKTMSGEGISAMNPSCNTYNWVTPAAEDVVHQLGKKRFREYFCAHDSTFVDRLRPLKIVGGTSLMPAPHLAGLRFSKIAFVHTVHVVQGASTTSWTLEIKKKKTRLLLAGACLSCSTLKIMNPSSDLYNLVAAAAEDVVDQMRKKRFREYFCAHDSTFMDRLRPLKNFGWASGCLLQTLSASDS
jgi:hypothetical protein